MERFFEKDNKEEAVIEPSKSPSNFFSAPKVGASAIYGRFYVLTLSFKSLYGQKS